MNFLKIDLTEKKNEIQILQQKSIKILQKKIQHRQHLAGKYDILSKFQLT